MRNDINKFLLPIGTVCKLKEDNDLVMIIGQYFIDEETDTASDYIACPYPYGAKASDRNILFDHKSIEKIYYMGYSDDEELDYRKWLINKLMGNDNEVNANE